MKHKDYSDFEATSAFNKSKSHGGRLMKAYKCAFGTSGIESSDSRSLDELPPNPPLQRPAASGALTRHCRLVLQETMAAAEQPSR